MTMDNRGMNFNDLKQHFGSVAKAAAALGLHRQAVYAWDGKGIPEGQQYKIEVLTEGALKADRGEVSGMENRYPDERAA